VNILTREQIAAFDTDPAVSIHDVFDTALAFHDLRDAVLALVIEWNNGTDEESLLALQLARAVESVRDS
jgi:hypothetical protein